MTLEVRRTNNCAAQVVFGTDLIALDAVVGVERATPVR